MKGYVKKTPREFLHATPKKPIHAPSKFKKPEYGQKIQYARVDKSKPLNEQIKKIQGATGKFLYSGRVIDNTTMHALNELSIGVSEATEEVQEAMNHFLDYLATHPNTEIIYCAFDMQLKIDSDAAYLVVAKRARSRAGGFQYFGNFNETLFNGPIYILAKIIKAVMASAAESECGSLNIKTQHAVPFITTLEELGHEQRAVPIRTDNSTAKGIMNQQIKQKRSKAFDMRFWWLVDRIEQRQFKVNWHTGKLSIAE